MRRYLLVWVICIAMLAAAGASVSALVESTPAQSAATPAASGEVVLTETSVSDEGTLVLVRITLAPGDGGGVNDPSGTRILAVESGTVHYRLDSGQATIIRGDVREQIDDSSDAWVELSPGDRVVESEGAVHEYENRGDEPATLVISAVVSSRAKLRCASGCWGE